jgi:cold shock protein
MSPILCNVTLNGASRHRLSKGFLLLQQNGQPVSQDTRQTFVNESNRYFRSQSSFARFSTEERSGSTCSIGLATPFLPVHTPDERDTFITNLSKAVSVLLQIATHYRLLLTPAGVNPFVVDNLQAPALSADLHQIEVYDDGEIERIYNLFRQFLPELLSISTHSAVFGGTMQKDFSMRMRVNPSSFLPRYLSQFTVEHLDKIKSMLRRSYGLAELTQMDINPMAGDTTKLMDITAPVLTSQPAAIELRFVDSQVSYPFIRAQIVLFQAIAIYGRGLARSGRRLPFLRDENIDENKALTVQNGAGAILVPDPKFSQERDGADGRKIRKKQYTFHDKGKPERATTALLMVIENLLISSLSELQCEFREIAPIILGAELRKRGRQCFANYAEYQKYLHYTYKNKFTQSFHEQSQQLLANPNLDPVTEYNQRTYKDITEDVEQVWEDKLQPNVRERVEGKIANINYEKQFGFIKVTGLSDVYFRTEDVLNGSYLNPNDLISFFIIEGKPGQGPRAVQIELIEAAPKSIPKSTQQPNSTGQKETGIVKKYDSAKQYGFITSSKGKDVFVHRSELRGVKELKQMQKVEFEIVPGDKGPKAINVCVIKEE